MSDAPTVDDRDREALFEALLARADAYTDAWDPHSPDAGRTLLRIFSTFEADVRKRLNEVPEKHLLAFLDALDFDRRPPQAARAPLTFRVSTDLDRNVAIPGGTQAVAETAGGASQLFELPQDGGFEATGARLTDAVGVDPAADAIVDHGDVVDGEESVELFVGESVQEHVLYMGSTDLLNLEAGSSFAIAIEAAVDADGFFAATEWEYYGEGADGTEGWHRLAEPSEGERADEDVGVETLQERLQSRSRAADRGRDDGTVRERTFALPGPTVERAVDGVESRWIRARLTGEPAARSATVESLSIHVGNAADDDGLSPDLLLSNDVPLSPDDGDLRPFGRIPHPPATFYVCCQEAFTKPGAVVDLAFAPPDGDGAAASAGADGSSGPGGRPSSGADDESGGDGASGEDGASGAGGRSSSATGEPSASADGGSSADADASAGQTAGVGVLGGPPRLSWEYWNGEGWTRLDSVEDGTDALRAPGTVRFAVPDDLAPTTVSGHENVWIRARLVGGTYGQPSFAVAADGSRGGLVDEPDAPRFGDVTVRYDRGQRPFDAVFRRNNAAYSEDLAGRDEPFAPFLELPDETQTLYLGFDDTLRNGPLTLFVPVEDATYPQAFDPGVQWEYCTDPEGFEWSKLDVRDRTGGLTERGIVALTFPEPTTAFELFDRKRHWIRARVTKDEFDRARGPSNRPSDEPERPRDESERPSNELEWPPHEPERPSDESQRLPRADAHAPASVPAAVSTERTRTPPVLEGLYPNTQWAYNTTTIEDEVLGSSDGSHEQTFRCAHAPVIDVDVWVDELSTLPSGERRQLAEERPDAVEPEYDARGEVAAFWVRWRAVDDFLDSTPTDRHYVINRTLGLVAFGDGDRGAIPPSGQDNVRATYTTGGGRDGNVAANTVTDLKSSVALVESVTNPTPADGGADAESTDALVARSTNRLKHRGRAVTARDYEQVAKAAFPELAQVACDPALAEGADGSRVTVLVVPQTEREKPVPSMELKHRVRDALADRAPASIVADADADVVVRGPGYGELSVETTVRATAVKSVSQLKGTIERRLDEYLHPLTGNDGDGWAFGELPDREALVGVVEAVDAVSDVLEFDVAIERNGERRSLSRYDAEATLPRDALVCSGTHEITVTMGERR